MTALVLCMILAATGCTSGTGGPSAAPSSSSPSSSPEPGQPGAYAALARAALTDMLSHYWNPETKQIETTWNGYPIGYDDPVIVDPRGAVWPRSMLLMPMLHCHSLYPDAELSEIVRREWNTIQALFTRTELVTPQTIVNTSVDDCGWNAVLYMMLYRILGDETALGITGELLANVYDRWYDEELGGPSLWYGLHDMKSLYQVGVLLASFEYAEATGDISYRMLAESCYHTLESLLLREDGLYFCDYTDKGIKGGDRPNDIYEAGSVSFLAGNMAMGVLHARLYALTGDAVYLERAQRTAKSLHETMIRADGVYLNDRDAWATGTFFPQYAAEVLVLPGMEDAYRRDLYATADSIATNARTEDGFYAGEWSGPLDGAWYKAGSRPEQIMTSGNTVLAMMGAAVLESGGK